MPGELFVLCGGVFVKTLESLDYVALSHVVFIFPIDNQFNEKRLKKIIGISDAVVRGKMFKILNLTSVEPLLG